MQPTNGLALVADVPTKESELDKVEELTEVVERDHRGPYTTEKGVVLKYQKVSSDTVRKAWTAIPVPKPPMVYIEERGREEPNPADPGYKNEIDQYNGKVNTLIYTIYLMRGVDIHYIPESVSKPDDTDWYEGLEEYLDIPTGRLARKAAWLMDYVLNDFERAEVVEDLAIFSGLVPEKKVEETLKSFRSDGVQQTDSAIPDIT